MVIGDVNFSTRAILRSCQLNGDKLEERQIFGKADDDVLPKVENNQPN